MRVKVLQSSIFDSDCDHVTNSVNTQGVMGAGLALEFRLRVPELFEAYRKKCEAGELRIGEYWIYDKQNRIGKKVLNFPTKKGFSHPSRWSYILPALEYFRQNYAKDNITSIAFPLLGSTQGKLDPSAVLEAMVVSLSDLPIRIEIHVGRMPDRFTVQTVKHIQSLTPKEIARQLKISVGESERLKSEIGSVWQMSELAAFKRFNLNLVQRLYDFGFETISVSKIRSYLVNK